MFDEQERLQTSPYRGNGRLGGIPPWTSYRPAAASPTGSSFLSAARLSVRFVAGMTSGVADVRDVMGASAV
jgi:hypothetical protein